MFGLRRSFMPSQRSFASFASMQKRKMPIQPSVPQGKSSQLRGMVANILFRNAGCTIAQLQVEQQEAGGAAPSDEATTSTGLRSLKTYTLQAYGGILSDKNVGDHVEVEGERAFPFSNFSGVFVVPVLMLTPACALRHMDCAFQIRRAVPRLRGVVQRACNAHRDLPVPV